jgi:riboflavin transporter FmnP
MSGENSHDMQPVTSHSATGDRSSAWSTRTIALEALLCAAAMALSFVEIPSPGAAFLKYDPSGIFPLLAGLWFGAWPAVIVGVISWIPHLLMNPVGALMAIAVNLALALPVAWMMHTGRRKDGSHSSANRFAHQSARPSVGRLIAALAVGTVVSIAIAIGANLIVTPLYTSASVNAVARMIVPILLPFNAFKSIVNCVVAGLIAMPLSRLVARTRN